MKPNARARAVAFSATLALDARAKELGRRGVAVINMAVGEPDFDAPQVVQEAAERAVRSGKVRYTPVAGLPGLRAAICAQLEATRGVAYTPEEVTVCSSAKHALGASLLCLLEPGDEVLLPYPTWNSYEEQIRFAGGAPVAVLPRDDGGPDFAALEAACSARTRGLLYSSPTNPSGYVWTAAEVERVVALATERDLWLLSDEIYRRLVYEGEPARSPASVGSEGRARTIIVDGASKAYAMTGYRIGFLAGDAELTSATARLNSQLMGCPNAVSQMAYEAALKEEPPEVAAMAAEFDRRRRFLLGALDELGLHTPWPRGAFYAFPSVTEHLDERGSHGFCEDLLEDQALALVPGAVFGMDQHVRLSYATSMENIREAVERLRKFLARR